MLFARVNNAFVETFEVSFIRGLNGARFLGYLRDRTAGLQCRINVLSIADFMELPADIDYALVDFVASHLKPQSLDAEYDAQQSYCATFQGRASIRSTLRHVKLCVSLVINTYMKTCAILYSYTLKRCRVYVPQKNFCYPIMAGTIR